MRKQPIRTVTQLVGAITLIAFALFGVLSFFGFDAPFVYASSAESTTSAASAATNSTIPATFNYEGILRNPDGTLRNTPAILSARIFDAAAGGAVLYEESFFDVTVRDGQFSIVLGDNPGATDLAAVFSQAPLYVEIAIDGNTQAPRERIHPVPWAINSYDGVPVGGIIDWWRPSDNNTLYPIPDGFAHCDGSVVNDPLSPLHDATLPNFTNRVALGAQFTSQIGGIGGSLTGTGTTNSAGTHDHLTYYAEEQSPGVYNVLTFDGNGGPNFIYQSGTVSQAGGLGGDLHLYIRPSSGGLNHYTSNDGAHTHSVSVNNNYQPYIQTLKLCRLR